EARPVLVLVGDVAAQDLEAVALPGFLGSDRPERRVARLFRVPRSLRRVDERNRRHAGELGEEAAALGERLRMRDDARDAEEGRAGEPEEAVAHLENLLAHDLQLRVPEEVVRLVDRARRRVLDREKGIPRRARLRLAQGAREGREAAELDRPLTVAEVLPRGEVAVGALGALKRHAMRVTERALGDLPVEKRLLLDLHGHRDD